MKVYKATVGPGFYMEDDDFEEKFRAWATSWDSSQVSTVNQGQLSDEVNVGTLWEDKS